MSERQARAERQAEDTQLDQVQQRATAYTIAVAHQAGGVGKTTTTVNLGYELARAGWRVLLVDLDTHYDLSRRLGLVPVEPTLAEVLTSGKGVPSPVTCTWGEVSLDVIPSDSRLADAEAAVNNIRQARENRLRVALRPLLGEYDVILLDCPATLNMLTTNALNAARGVIVPVQSQDKAYNAIPLTSQVVDEVAQFTELDILGYLITMTRHTNAEREIATAIREDYPTQTFRTAIPHRVEFIIDSRYQAPVGTYRPDSDGALAYQQLAGEVMERIAQAEALNA